MDSLVRFSIRPAPGLVKFYNQNCAGGVFAEFTNIVENALRRCVKIERVFIRNDQNRETVQKTWIEKESKRIIAKININMHPDDAPYQMIQRNLLHIIDKVRSEYQKHLFQQLEMSRGASLTKQETETN